MKRQSFTRTPEPPLAWCEGILPDGELAGPDCKDAVSTNGHAGHSYAPAATHASSSNRAFASAGSLPSTPPLQPAREQSAGKASSEEWIGRNAVGVVASVLVFLGLAAFGIAVATQFDDSLKVAFMFTLSGLLAVAGSAMAMRRRNGFTCALMGCGMGSLFISVLVTHLHFGMIEEIVALGLSLVWMVACLALMRKTESLLLAIVLQLGLTCSVCLGYAGELDGGKIAFIVAYQLAASIIVVVGNLMFYRKMYRASLLTALSLGVVASLFMWAYFGWDLRDWADEFSLAWVAVAFGVQFLSAIVLAGLLVASVMGQIGVDDTGAERVEDYQATAGTMSVSNSDRAASARAAINASSPACEIAEADGRTGARTQSHFPAGKKHRFGNSPRRFAKQKLMLVAAASLVVVAVRLDVYNVVERCATAGIWGSPWRWQTEFFYAVLLATFVMLAVLAAVAFAIVAFARRRPAASSPENTSIPGNGLEKTQVEQALAQANAVAGCSVSPQGASAPGSYPTKAQVEQVLSQAQADAGRAHFLLRLSRPALMVVIVSGFMAVAYATLVAANHDTIPFGWMWIWALLAIALWKAADDAVYRVAALVFIGIDALHMSVWGFAFFEPQLGMTTAALLGMAYVIGLSGLAVAIVRSFGSRDGAAVVLGVCCTCLLMSYLYHCTPLAGEDYQWSVCCMACALVSVAVGFKRGVGGLRLYGLVLALACVAKLVLLDLSDLDSLARAGALVIGGLICFAISALYNYAAKRVSSAESHY